MKKEQVNAQILDVARQILPEQRGLSLGMDVYLYMQKHGHPVLAHLRRYIRYDPYQYIAAVVHHLEPRRR